MIKIKKRDLKMNKRYNYDSLTVEITRKCNLKCRHCMRGEAQNITLSTEVIDKIFEQVKDCRTLSLTGGGEALLEIEVIDYLVDKINANGWNTESIQITTNGTIVDKRIINILEKFCNKKKNRLAYMRISADKFHDIAQSEATYLKYKKMTNNKAVNILLGEKQIESFKFTGRGIEYILTTNDLDSFGVVSVPFLEKHRIKVNNDKVFCSLLIASNGNVLFDEEASYETQDEWCMGNILNESLSDMIEKNNKECLLSCVDWENLYTLNNHVHGYMSTYLKPSFVRELYKPMLETALKTYNKLYECRKLAHKMFPYIPAQDIIEHIPMPQNCLTDAMWCKTILDSFDSLTTMSEMAVFKTLSELNEKYKSGEIKYSNDKILPCTPND